MKTPQRECADKITKVSNPERILRDRGRIAAAWSVPKAVANDLTTRHSLEAAVEEAVSPSTWAQDENAFGAIVESSVSEERPASRTLLAQSTSLAKTGKSYLRDALRYSGSSKVCHHTALWR